MSLDNLNAGADAPETTSEKLDKAFENVRLDRYVYEPEIGEELDLVALGLVDEDDTFEPFLDALIVGDLNSPEALEVLDSELVVGFSERAPRVAADKWVQKRITWREGLNGFARHPVQTAKEGSAVFFYDTALTGKKHSSSGETSVFAYRGKQHVNAVTAVAIDVDGTDTVDRVKERVIELGIFAIIYTTHSHYKKKTHGGDYFRVIIPLARSFRVADFGGDIACAARAWAAKYSGFVELLGINEVDKSAARFGQMMYLPRRRSADADYRHYVIAGRALKLEEMPETDVAQRVRSGKKSDGARQRDGATSRSNAILRDGFDVYAWFKDHGAAFDVEPFLETIGWDVRNYSAGEGLAVMCPNHLEHSEPDDGNDEAGWCCPTDGEQSFVFTCLHNHCEPLCTWDFIAKIEDRIEDGDAVLPDEYSSLSQVLCDPVFYPEIDGLEPPSISPEDYGAKYAPIIEPLKSPDQVQDAFDQLAQNTEAGDAHYIAVCAGVAIADNRRLAVKKLDDLLKGTAGYNGNEIASLKKRAQQLVAEQQAEVERIQQEEMSREAESAFGAEDLAHESMDIADPLGDTLAEAMATLANRWQLVAVGGRYRVLIQPDTESQDLGGAKLQTMSREDFVSFHIDRKIKVEDQWINPAELFLSVAPRCSAIVFAPPPSDAPPNAYNIYRGRTHSAKQGDCSVLKDFVLDTVCSGRQDVFEWIWLWMAHMVQRPGEKPGTAIALRGKGRCGKSTFGLLLQKLAAPYALTLAHEENVTGRFANENLSTAVLAVCTEALFAGGPGVDGKIKSQVTSPTLMVEPKGLPATEMKVCTRFFFDSNSERVVPIGGDGSELRYLVMEISDEHMDDREYFEPIYDALDSDQIAALIWELEHYVPEEYGQSWADLRTAPLTPERQTMRWHSMRPVQRAMLKIFEEGAFELRLKSGISNRYVFQEGQPILIPQSELREYLQQIGSQHEANDSKPDKLMISLFGETITDKSGKTYATVSTLRPKISHLTLEHSAGASGWTPIDRENIRCFQFPPVDVLQAEMKELYQLNS